MNSCSLPGWSSWKRDYYNIFDVEVLAFSWVGLQKDIDSLSYRILHPLLTASVPQIVVSLCSTRESRFIYCDRSEGEGKSELVRRSTCPHHQKRLRSLSVRASWLICWGSFLKKNVDLSPTYDNMLRNGHKVVETLENLWIWMTKYRGFKRA